MLLLLYRSRNLGDMMQTLALSRLLPPCSGVFRHRLPTLEQGSRLIVNGMLDKDRTPGDGASCLFAGVSGPHFRKGAYLRWMAGSPYPIGARDPATVKAAEGAGLRAVLLGCATLTLPRYSGPRAGIYSVDVAGPGEALTQRITRSMPVEEQWALALAMIEKYRTAEAVYTSRLHVALPCLAFGTPVWIANPAKTAWHPSRFGILDALGVGYEKLAEADVSAWALRYAGFLEQHIGLRVEPGEPKLPACEYRPARWIPEWWRW
jgi:hypothetical protein